MTGNHIEEITDHVQLHLSRCNRSQRIMQPEGPKFRGDAAEDIEKSQIYLIELPSLPRLGLRMPYERSFECLK
jgi:hypothetical protein